jgi:hypothetical protein
VSYAYHNYFRDKMKAMETAGLITSVADTTVGYTERAAAEAANQVAGPTLLKGSNWFFGGAINKPNGQTHTSG